MNHFVCILNAEIIILGVKDFGCSKFLWIDTKAVIYCIMLRVIRLGLALLYSYSSLTLENNLRVSIITVVVVFIILVIFSFLYSEFSICNYAIFFCYSNNIFSIIAKLFLSEIRFTYWLTYCYHVYT